MEESITVENGEMPSAQSFANDSKLPIRSFMQTKNSSGPSTEPCETLALTNNQLDS